MNFAMIYAKTARGIAEIKARSNQLSPQARRVLIMIDGRRSETELAPVVRGSALDGVLAELRGLGMIEECGIAELPADAAAAAADEVTVALDAGALRLDLGTPAAARRAAPPPPPPTLRVTVAQSAAVRRADTAAPQAAVAAAAVAAAVPPRAAPVLHPVPQPVAHAPAAAPTQAAPTPAARPAGAPRRLGEPEPGSLEDTKRAAVRALFERLGPYGEEPAARIQECKTLDALQGELTNACKRISTFRGEAASREYMAALGMA